jgi:transcription antitermination factor NusG
MAIAGRPRKNRVATTPVFEHLEEEFGRQVISAQTCGSYREPGLAERWFLAHVHPNMDFVALVDLARIGFPVHLGLFVEPTRRNPSRPGGLQNGTPVIRRLFPGYLFVMLDFERADWPLVKTGRGVDRLITRTNGVPAPVPQHEMDLLLRRCGSDGYEDEFTPDSERSDPWVNLTSLSDKDRLVVLHQVMQARFGRKAA